MGVTCFVVVDAGPGEELVFEYPPRVGDHVHLPGAAEPPHPIVRVAHGPVRAGDTREPSVTYFVSRETFLYRVHTGAIEGYTDHLKAAKNKGNKRHADQT